MVQLVIPVSHVDWHLAKPLIEKIYNWGIEASVVTAWSERYDVEIPEGWRHIVIPDPSKEGWPAAANHMFYHTALAVRRDRPWYFFEADNYPLSPCFFDALCQEYEAAGKPYMGAINATRWDLPDGRRIRSGRHMVGTGFYPADFLQRCSLVHHISPDIPFDVGIEREVVPECHETRLIHHAWGTASYTLRDGELVPQVGRTHYLKPVPKDALVIHGCKDLSLSLLFPSNA